MVVVLTLSITYAKIYPTSLFSSVISSIIPITAGNTYSGLVVESDNMVLSGSQKLINIPDKTTPVKLNVYLLSGTNKIKADYSKLNFVITHHVSDITDPSKIISVDPQGNLRYLSEGFVSLNVKYPSVNLESGEIIIATGNVYGDKNKDNVIAVFPKNYAPPESKYTFEYMMNKYPYINTINMAYNEISKLYSGFKPFAGNKQILALLVLPNNANGNNNPLEVSPGGYLRVDNGSPQYDTVIHEMGHNFSYSKGMSQLLHPNGGNSIINSGGFGECVASLPLQYLREKILENPEKYNIATSSFEYINWTLSQKSDNAANKERLGAFESYIKKGRIKGIFDIDNASSPEDILSSLQGNVGAFCSLFVTPAAYPKEYGNQYGWEFYSRFFSLFGDKDLLNYQSDKVETYFSAAYSAAMGKDMRSKLKFWGFSIDDTYYNQIYPQLVLLLPSTPVLTPIYPVCSTTKNTCSVGTIGKNTGVTNDGTNRWYWACVGQNTEWKDDTAWCFAPRSEPAIIYPSCGSASNIESVNQPSSNLCKVGTVGRSGFGDGKWYWACVGQNTGWPEDTAWCFAPKITTPPPPPVTTLYPVCGAAQNVSSTVMPTKYLCSTGNISDEKGYTTDGTNRWYWGCVGQNTGWEKDTAWCFAPRSLPATIYPSCGSSANTASVSLPTSDLCLIGSVGSSKGETGDGTNRWFWGCVGQNTGWPEDAAWCFANK